MAHRRMRPSTRVLVGQQHAAEASRTTTTANRTLQRCEPERLMHVFNLDAFILFHMTASHMLL